MHPYARNLEQYHVPACNTQPTATAALYLTFNGIRTGAYCKTHAEDGMVDALLRRCLHDPCRTVPAFDVEDNETGAQYSKHHAKDGAV